MHILFVDDTRDTRDLFSLVFEMQGFKTQTANDGAEALAAVQGGCGRL
jgi:CheY-like chemotaxis protein